jgi:hypothetical protein
MGIEISLAQRYPLRDADCGAEGLGITAIRQQHGNAKGVSSKKGNAAAKEPQTAMNRISFGPTARRSKASPAAAKKRG